VEIVKHRRSKTRQELHDEKVLPYWLLWASRPRDAEPDETGAYFIGGVENAPEKNWERAAELKKE
jgi:hypothetical protein